jgi:hypothetical protein
VVAEVGRWDETTWRRAHLGVLAAIVRSCRDHAPEACDPVLALLREGAPAEDPRLVAAVAAAAATVSRRLVSKAPRAVASRAAAWAATAAWAWEAEAEAYETAWAAEGAWAAEAAWAWEAAAEADETASAAAAAAAAAASKASADRIIDGILTALECEVNP